MICERALSFVTSPRLKFSTMSSMYSIHSSSGFRCSSSSNCSWVGSSPWGRGESFPVDSCLVFRSCLTSGVKGVRGRRSLLVSRVIEDSCPGSTVPSSVRRAAFDPRVLEDPFPGMVDAKSSTLQCPSHSCRNPQESTGILRTPQEWHWNPQESSGILRNGTGIELKSSGMSVHSNVCI